LAINLWFILAQSEYLVHSEFAVLENKHSSSKKRELGTPNRVGAGAVWSGAGTLASPRLEQQVPPLLAATDKHPQIEKTPCIVYI
jgi:hypothetical protein